MRKWPKGQWLVRSPAYPIMGVQGKRQSDENGALSAGMAGGETNRGDENLYFAQTQPTHTKTPPDVVKYVVVVMGESGRSSLGNRVGVQHLLRGVKEKRIDLRQNPFEKNLILPFTAGKRKGNQRPKEGSVWERARLLKSYYNNGSNASQEEEDKWS